MACVYQALLSFIKCTIYKAKHFSYNLDKGLNPCYWGVFWVYLGRVHSTPVLKMQQEVRGNNYQQVSPLEDLPSLLFH